MNCCNIRIFIIVFSFLIYSACSENSINYFDADNSLDYSEQYMDSLIFLSNRFSTNPSVFTICIMNVDGSGLHQLHNASPVYSLTWDLNIGKIYFAAYNINSDFHYDIYQCGLNGTEERLIHSSADQIAELKISPDGDLLAFLTQSGVENKLNLLNLTTLENDELTGFITNLRSITWSPDGESIGCAYKDGFNLNLKMFRLDNRYFSQEREFQDMVRDHNYVDWCAETNNIAVNVNHYGFALSYVYDYSTKTDTNITSGNYYVEGLSWSPDGSKIAISQTYNHINVASIYIYNADGTNAFKLTDDLYDDKFPCWH